MQNAARSAPNQEFRAVPSLQLVEVARKPTDDAAYWSTDTSVVPMQRPRDGDMEAFQVLFSNYRGAIARYADRFLHSRDRAEEIAQNAFLQLFLARERYQPKARFATFLYRITANLCRNYRATA